MGSPVLFKQPRPGLIGKDGNEKIFYMYKFRTMTDAKDKEGNLLPDEQRLPAFGKWLRSISLDELPELFNIFKGDMSLIGPRPFLVRDMVFMSDEIRTRHPAKPGLSGLAQINGRNAITWEDKFKWDLKYVENVTVISDIKILIKTVFKVFGRSESSEELDVTYDYGDWLLQNNQLSQQEFDNLQKKANKIIENLKGKKS
jgi:lipopolysaccharide/colanic/teichoic acid biosynthesis glycosyltransferase